MARRCVPVARPGVQAKRMLVQWLRYGGAAAFAEAVDGPNHDMHYSACLELCRIGALQRNNKKRHAG